VAIEVVVVKWPLSGFYVRSAIAVLIQKFQTNICGKRCF